MNTLEFIHLHPVGLDCSTLEKGVGAEELKKAWICQECGTCKPSVGSVDVQIQESHPPEPITTVYGYGITIAKLSFLEKLGLERVRTHLALGSVYGPFGQLMSDWVTVRGRPRLIVRGSKNVAFRCCKVCGQQFYFAMGQRYLYPAPPPNIAIFESDLGGLVVSPEVFAGASLHRSKGLGIETLKVLPQPKDSLGDLRI